MHASGGAGKGGGGDGMQLHLVRERSIDGATLGALFVGGAWFCWTLEDQVREVPGVTVQDWKIPARTAIPVGDYALTVTPSQRFGRPLPLLVDVPGFQGIRIHRGNTAEDTEGCIIVGFRRGPASVLDSRACELALTTRLIETGPHRIRVSQVEG